MKTNLLFSQASALSKRLAMLLTVLLTVSIGQVWGAEQKFSPSTDKGSITANGISDGDTFTKYGFTISSSNGVLGNGSNYRVYTDGTFTISSSVGNITAISFTFSGTNTGGFKTSYTGLSTNSWSATATSQARITQIVVTYTAASTDPYTVTLKDDDSTLTQSSAGATITLPSRDGCAGYEFVGWTKTWSVDQTTWTTTAPTIIPAGSYTPTANESLYPVYTKTEGGTPVPATLTASYTSNSGWTATGCGGSSYWVLKQNASITSPVISDLSTVTSITFKVRTYGGSSYKTVNVSTSGGTSIGSASASSTTLTSKTINVSNLSGSGSIVFSSSTTSSSNGPGINNITINYSTGGSTTYYISVPDCATQTVICMYHNSHKIGIEQTTYLSL